MRAAAIAFLPLALVVALCIGFPAEAARGGRIAFLIAGAPVLGSVLMLAIAKVTGADWSIFARFAAAAPAIAVAAVLLGVAAAAGQGWQTPPAVAARGVVAAALLAWAGRRLAGATPAFAAGTLALYTLFVTPVAYDWLLDGVHSVTAAGMMLAVQQIGGACALLLLTGAGSLQLRRDMAKLLVAAALGLSYLGYMDYLIVWYGDLPARVDFYVTRQSTTPIVVAALAVGLAGTIAVLSLIAGERRFRIAGASALLGLALFDWWWIGGGAVAAVAALLSLMVIAAACALALRWTEPAHG